jgi:hypothetical protein
VYFCISLNMFCGCKGYLSPPGGRGPPEGLPYTHRLRQRVNLSILKRERIYYSPETEGEP